MKGFAGSVEGDLGYFYLSTRYYLNRARFIGVREINLMDTEVFYVIHGIKVNLPWRVCIYASVNSSSAHLPPPPSPRQATLSVKNQDILIQRILPNPGFSGNPFEARLSKKSLNKPCFGDAITLYNLAKVGNWFFDRKKTSHKIGDNPCYKYLLALFH